MALLDMLVGPVLDIVNKIIPTPMTAEQKTQAQIQLLQLQQAGEFKQLDNQLAQIQTQTDTNKIEAANSSIFVAGWRPFIGWICGTGVGCNYVGTWFVNTISALFGHPLHVPPMDLSEMMPLLIGMLGLGGMRTVEKINGVNSGH